MDRDGVVRRGPYQGQRFRVAIGETFPRWVEVYLTDANGHSAVREVKADDLEFERSEFRQIGDRHETQSQSAVHDGDRSDIAAVSDTQSQHSHSAANDEC